MREVTAANENLPEPAGTNNNDKVEDNTIPTTVVIVNEDVYNVNVTTITNITTTTNMQAQAVYEDNESADTNNVNLSKETDNLNPN